MARRITDYMPTHGKTPALLIGREDDDSVSVIASDETGARVRVKIPPAAWFRMARQIYQCRSLLSTTA